MKRQLVQLILAITIALHGSEAVRLAYIWFDIAPTCPIVGRDRVANRCDNNVSIGRKSFCHREIGSSTDVGEEGPSSTPSNTPPVTRSECSTCQMFVGAQRIGLDVSLATISFVDQIAYQTWRFDNQISFPPSLLVAIPRGPPVV